MLQKLRDKTSGWIAIVILGLLCIPFAFFGMEQYLFARNPTFVAKVEAPPASWPSAPSWWPVSMLWRHEEVSTQDFRTAFERARQQQREAQGDRFDPRAFESIDNKRATLDTLIDQTVLRMAASGAGIAVSDAQVRDEIQQIPTFQVDGKFDPQRYQLALASQAPPLTPQGFQQQVRESIQQSIIPRQVAGSAFVTPSEMERLMTMIGERRDVSFVVLPQAAEDTAAVSAAEVSSWYDAHKASYRAPETVSIEYVDIDGSTLAVPDTADESTLRARYAQEKARFVEPDQRHASHILIQVDKDADARTQQAARDKATRLAAEARKPGADFAALAKANSDDTGSKAAGGDLGWISQDGSMVKPFEDALFAMKAGEISDPVRTDFGWHVIDLREVRAGKQTSFEEARAELEREQSESGRERAFNELSGRLVDQVLKNPTSLASAARSANLPVRKTEPFARGQGTGIAANPAVERAAFSDALIQDGTVSDPIEIAPEHSVLIRVTSHEPERAQSLAQVRERVIAEVRGERMRKAAAARADAMVAKLQGGQALDAVAKADDLQAQDVPNVPRGAPVPSIAASEAYFAAPAPAAGKVSPGKVALDDGRMLVFAVTKVTRGDPKEATEEQRTQLRAQLAQAAGAEDANALLEAMRKRMKITVVEERM